MNTTTEQSKQSFDRVSFIMDLEDGGLDEDQVIDGMQHLIDDDSVWHLQGSYQRIATKLIENGACTKPEASQRERGFGPYERVTKHMVRTFDNRRSFKIFIYGAYNAMGLIGSEHNGIGVLDEDNLKVVCDEICNQTFECHHGMIDDTYKRMTEDMSWDEFQALVNSSSRLRNSI